MSKHPFPHERLDAWHVARRARVLVYRFTKTLPPGFGDESRQLNNAAASVVRNIGEGANRYRPAEKVHKFEIAGGEAGEAVSSMESLLDLEVGEAELAREAITLEGRVAAMMTGLIRRHRR